MLMMAALPSGVTPVLLAVLLVPTIAALLAAATVNWCEVGVAVFTCKVETGMVKVWTSSGDCWTGEVAVWAVFCFSRLRHLARLFWNQTCIEERHNIDTAP